MAQTKKRRRTKHRGNAAGMIESRGRTGRPPSADERKASERQSAADRRRERMLKPPTWRGATTRAALAAAVFGVLLVLGFGQSVGRAVPLTAFVFVFYVPLGYYTDVAVHRWRVKRGGGASKGSRPKKA